MYPNIAFFDSGQGGLTIWEKVIQTFPNLNTLYLGDNARCPYGNKSSSLIVDYSKQASFFLKKNNAKCIVIVCGTASSAAQEYLNKNFDIPIFGIVEGFCKYGSEIIKDSIEPVAILATQYTIQSKRFETELKKYGVTNVWSKACPLFVPLVESGVSDGPMLEHAFNLYLQKIPKNVKIVMLACTHYPRIVQALSKYLAKLTYRSVVLKSIDGDKTLVQVDHLEDPIFLLDASISIIIQIKDFIKNYLNSDLNQGYRRFLCTDGPKNFSKIATHFTNLTLPEPELVDIANINC